MDLAYERALQDGDDEKAIDAEVIKRCRSRAKKMLAHLKANNPKSYWMVRDPSPHVAALCPRRAGKTYAAVLAALITGETKPGSISLIISLNLKQLKRLYWKGGPSGLFTLAKKFGLNLKYNGTELRWEHENGSIGYLLGCDDDDQLEVIRGLEADMYVVDECKSFAPSRLRKLVDDIIDPQRPSRNGRLIMIGTPGYILKGPFPEATNPSYRHSDKKSPHFGRPLLIPYGEKDPWGRVPDDVVWSFHNWSLEDNSAKPQQWTAALAKKKSKGWESDHPTWLREYMGVWAAGGEGLVYRYGSLVDVAGKVTWQPQPSKGNPAGLPEEGAPWRFVAGLDIGYEAPTALVVAAYSRKMKELRHVADYSEKHLLPPGIAALIDDAIERFGPIEMIYADKANLGKTLVNHLAQDRGFPLEPADKREKYDYIEIVNGAFEDGQIKIIPGTTLEEQLLTNAWDLEGDDTDEERKNELARLGKLREDPAIPNDSADAFLYMYRGSLHHFGMPEQELGPEEGTVAWYKLQTKRELQSAREGLKREDAAKRGNNSMRKAPTFIKRALRGTKWDKTPNRVTHSTRAS